MPALRTSAEQVIELARMLHTSGVPAQELEERMRIASQILNEPAQFFSTPTSLFISFEGEDQKTHMVRVTPAGLNLEQLSLMHQLLNGIESGQMTSDAIGEEMAKIDSMPDRFGPLVTTACFGLAAGTASVFFGGGLDEAIVSSMIGLIVFLIVFFCDRKTHTRHLSDMAAAFTATVLSNLGGWFIPTLSTEITILGSLIVLLPGLSLTVAINELATQNLASGSARLAGALTTFLTMAFGVVMGRSLLLLFFQLPENGGGTPFPNWYVGISLLLASIAFSVLFQARARDTGWILLAATTSYLGARLGGFAFGPAAAAWTGAFLLGIASNLFGRLCDRPPAVMMVPGMILLVPGSLGFFSLSALVNHDIDSGIEAAFSMTLVAASIVAGLLMANALIPSRTNDLND